MKNNKINVLHVLFNLEMGGAENLVVNIVKGLNKNAFATHVCCIRKGGVLETELADSQIPYQILNHSDNFDWVISKEIAQLSKRLNIHIIHSHHLGPLMYSWLATKFYNQMTIVHTEHSYDYLADSKKLNIYGGFFFRKPKKVVAVTEDVSRYIGKEYRVPQSRLVTITNGIDIRQFERAITANYREKLDIDKDTFVIGTVGRLESIKNHATLIDAFSQFKKRVPNSVLLLIGDGSLRADLEKLTADLGLTPSIKFLGLRRDIPPLLKTMDVFVLPSYSEGLSLALLEAISSRVPVIASNVGGNANIIVDGNNGLLFDPYKNNELTNALLRLNQDRSLIKTYSENAFALVNSRYSLERMIREYEDIYREANNENN
jgi:glycosyltransferase involved in cell wall biosynthesis